MKEIQSETELLSFTNILYALFDLLMDLVDSSLSRFFAQLNNWFVDQCETKLSLIKKTEMK